MDDLDQQIVLKTAEVDMSRFQSNSKHSQNNAVSNGGTSYNNLSYPHFSIPLSVSTLYGRGDWSCLHKEDDVLVRRAGSAPKVRTFCECFLNCRLILREADVTAEMMIIVMVMAVMMMIMMVMAMMMMMITILIASLYMPLTNE